MRPRLPAAVRGVPVTVIVFTVLALVLDALEWVLYFARLSKDPLWNVFWFALALGGLSAIVIWRQSMGAHATDAIAEMRLAAGRLNS
jgi:hypothetical protein